MQNSWRSPKIAQSSELQYVALKYEMCNDKCVRRCFGVHYGQWNFHKFGQYFPLFLLFRLNDLMQFFVLHLIHSSDYNEWRQNEEMFMTILNAVMRFKKKGGGEITNTFSKTKNKGNTKRSLNKNEFKLK